MQPLGIKYTQYDLSKNANTGIIKILLLPNAITHPESRQRTWEILLLGLMCTKTQNKAHQKLIACSQYNFTDNLLHLMLHVKIP